MVETYDWGSCYLLCESESHIVGIFACAHPMQLLRRRVLCELVSDEICAASGL